MIAYQRNQQITVGVTLQNAGDYLLILHWIKQQLLDTALLEIPAHQWSFKGLDVDELWELATKYHDLALQHEEPTSFFLTLEPYLKEVPTYGFEYLKPEHAKTLQTDDLLYVYYRLGATLQEQIDPELYRRLIESVDSPSFYSNLLTQGRRRPPKEPIEVIYQREEGERSFVFHGDDLVFLQGALQLIAIRLFEVESTERDWALKTLAPSETLGSLGSQIQSLEVSLHKIPTTTGAKVYLKESRIRRRATLYFEIKEDGAGAMTLLDYRYLWLSTLFELRKQLEGIGGDTLVEEVLTQLATVLSPE